MEIAVSEGEDGVSSTNLLQGGFNIGSLGKGRRMLTLLIIHLI